MPDRAEVMKNIAERWDRVAKAPETSGREHAAAGPLLTAVQTLQERMGRLEDAAKSQQEKTSPSSRVLSFNPATGGIQGERTSPGTQSPMPGFAPASFSAAPSASSALQGTQTNQAPAAAPAALAFNPATGGIAAGRDFPAPFAPSVAASMPTQPERTAQQQLAFNLQTGGITTRQDGAATSDPASPLKAFVSGNSGTQGGRIPPALGSNPAMAQLRGQAPGGSPGNVAPDSTSSSGGIQEMLSKGTSGAGGLGDRELIERLMTAMEALTEAFGQRGGQEQKPGPQSGGGFTPAGPQSMAGREEFGEVKGGAFPSLKTGIPSPGMAAVARAGGF